MQAELILTGTRSRVAAFQQTAHSQALARLDEGADDPWARRRVQHAVIALCTGATWSGTEDQTTLTLVASGHAAVLREAAETLQRQARDAGLAIAVTLQADPGDAQAQAEQSHRGRSDPDSSVPCPPGGGAARRRQPRRSLNCGEGLSMTTLPAVHVGSVVTAKCASGVCDPGERGVCAEVYELAGRPGWSFLFESGRYDGFSPADVATFLEVTGAVCQAVADDQFRNVGQRCRDFHDGRFDPVFHVKHHGNPDR